MLPGWIYSVRRMIAAARRREDVAHPQQAGRTARMFCRLLVAFDGSAHSQRALDEAIELAQANHGSVTVMTVAPEPSRLWSVGLGYGDPLNLDGLGYQVERQWVRSLLLRQRQPSRPARKPDSGARRPRRRRR